MYTIKTKTEEVKTKGNTNYGTVTSTSSGTYPTNGASGNYWYTYLGYY